MFYRPEERDRARLPHDPFKAIIAPRPIGWISALSASGAVNLAPYSFFNAVASAPVAVLAFSSEGVKDSVTFIEETREFVWNMPTFGLREAMNATSAPLPRGSSEFEHAGLAAAPSVVVKPPRVAASPCALECRLIEIIHLKTAAGVPIDNHLVLGEVVGVHIDDRFITAEGRVDTAAMQPIARCGYADYAVVDRVFPIRRPR
jgi:flavin reductase (DIM6/NTAB) family NADH-FMN oxidoreductase RutF